MPKQTFFCASFPTHIDFLQLTMQKIPIQTTALHPHYCRTRYRKLCALPIFQLFPYCNSNSWRHPLYNLGYARVHSFILSRWVTHEMWRPLWITCKNTFHFCRHVCIFSYPSSCIAFWQLQKLLLLWPYLDAGVVPCGNSTCDLWPSNMHSLTR